MIKLAIVVFRECMEIAFLLGVILAVTKPVKDSRAYVILGSITGVFLAALFTFFAKTLSESGHKVLLVDYQPTSEKMVVDFAHRIAARLPSHIKLHNVRLHETATAYAEWYASDQE